jgi:hypothetical protein
MRHPETVHVDMPYFESWQLPRLFEHLRTLSTGELERFLNIYEDRSANNRAIRAGLEREITTSEYDELERLKNIQEYHVSYRDMRNVHGSIEQELEMREDYQGNYDE